MPPFLPLEAVTAASLSLDESWFRALNLAGTNPGLDILMSLFSAIALPYVIALLAVPMWWKGHRELALDLLVVLFLVIVVTEAVKFAINRARPCDALTDVHLLAPTACAQETDPAFPSGHASRIFGAAALLGFSFRWRVRVGAFGLAALTGVSRIYLGVHWPSDVLGGAVLGIALALAFVAFARRSRLYPKVRAWVIDAVAHLVARLSKG